MLFRSSTGAALTDVLAGQAPVLMGSLLPVTPHIHSGKLRGLAVTTAKRWYSLPDMPTLSDTIPGYVVELWHGTMAPAGTPLSIVNALNAAINRAMETPEMKRNLEQQGMIPTGGTPARFGERIAADAVVFNGDANALANGLLGDEARAAVPPVTPRERSLSAVTWCLHAPARGFPLEHHSVFFGDDYEREFRAVFDHGRIAEEPTVYLCAQDRGVTGRALPTNRERMLLLVNAPADGDGAETTARDLAAIEQRMFTVLERCGLTFERRSEDCVVTTPTGFERAFPGSGGALYGRANHGPLASFARPAAASKIAGLYLAGGTAHPGAGIPMATLSGRLEIGRAHV